MTPRNIIKGAAVHLTNISIGLYPRTFFVKYTFESGRDLPEARDLHAENLRILQLCGTYVSYDCSWKTFVKNVYKTNTG